MSIKGLGSAACTQKLDHNLTHFFKKIYMFKTLLHNKKSWYNSTGTG